MMAKTWRHLVAVVATYAAVGLLPVWNLLRQGVTSHTVSPDADPAMPIWGIGYYAHAIAHGHLPFVTDVINAPSGFSTWISTPLWSTLLVPVTWIIGAVGAFNLLLFLLPVLNSFTAYFALRHYVHSVPIRWLTGLVWGFSPFVMSSLALGWINWGTQLSIPLIVIVVSEASRNPRWTSRRTGLALSAIGIVTFLTNSEELVILAGAAFMSTLTWVLIQIASRRSISSTTKHFFVVAAGWALVPLCAVALPVSYFATHGVGALPDWVWPRYMFETQGSSLASFVSPATFHGRIFTTLLTYPNFAYVGVATPLLALWGVARSWRQSSTILVCVIALWATVFAMGVHGPFQVYRLLLEFPIVHNVMPRSFFPCTLFALLMLAAIGCDDLASRPRHRTVRVSTAVFASLLVAVPLLTSAFVAVPWKGRMPGDDPAARAIAARSSERIVVLTYPFPVVGRGLVAQTKSGFTYRIVGAMGPTANRDFTDGEFLQSMMAGFTNFGLTSEFTVPKLTRLRSAIAATGATWAVVPISLPREVNQWGYAAPQVTVAAYVAMWGMPTKFGHEWAFSISESGPVDIRVIAQMKQCLRGDPEQLPSCLTSSPAS